ncbi:MAG TPA: MinD/ParA family protein [Planctomycetes bacterium]|nr:MinD/ParA family protein [Planctomycetota bacterium]
MRDQAWKLRRMVEDRVQPVKGRARVLAITSGKGGVGKTNISIGLAITAATAGLKTVLIDGDLGLANIDVLLDIHPRKNLGHLVSGGASLRDVLVRAPGGFQVLPGASGLSRVADMGHMQQQVLFEVLGRLMEENDLILIDTGAGISRSVVDLCTSAGEVLVVTTPEPPAIVDAYAMLKVFSRATRAPKCWLVVNQAQSRGEAQQVMGRMRGLARQFLSMEIERGGAILHDPRVPASVRRRQHFSLAYPSSPAAQGVRDLCESLGLSREKGNHGFLQRLRNLLSGDLKKIPERAH